MAEGMQRGSIEIDAAPAVVMEEIADFESYPDWTGEIKKAEIRKRDTQKRGKQVYYEVAMGPLKADYVLDYTYSANDAGVSWTMLEGNGVRKIEGEYQLESLAGGKRTKVTYEMTVESPLPMPGFMRRQVERKAIDVALKGLKKRVESKR